jgi:hypothetical protein
MQNLLATLCAMASVSLSQIIRAKPLFSPSRFVGYRDNTLHDHLRNRGSKDLHGSKTTTAIKKFRSRPLADQNLESEYQKFCVGLGIEIRAKAPFGRKRILGPSLTRRLTGSPHRSPSLQENENVEVVARGLAFE